MALSPGLSEAEIERKRWLEGMLKYLRTGKIVEFGCGAGFVLETLAESLPQSFIVGLDQSGERLEQVNDKGLTNVIAVCGDAIQNPFLSESFDTALFVGVLHEIYSDRGRRAVSRALKAASRVLKTGGILAIQDFLKPGPKRVELSFKNEKTEKRFLEFADQFELRRIRFRTTSSGVRLDIGDAVEFISKYRSQDLRDWKEEMREAHFALTLREYREAMRRAGFSVEVVTRLPRGEARWKETRRDIGFAHELEYGWVMLIARK